MIVRVITADGFYDYCDDNNLQISTSDLTDEQFMEIYESEGGDCEFESLELFAEHFNDDRNDVPVPDCHIIRFFNE